MQTLAERLPGFDDKELATLHSNAKRLEHSGTTKQQTAAADLLPLIDAELADRKAKAPPKAVRAKAPAKPRKAAAPKGKAAKADAEADDDADEIDPDAEAEAQAEARAEAGLDADD